MGMSSVGWLAVVPVDDLSVYKGQAVHQNMKQQQQHPLP
jgi:hypothetical protein